MSYSRKQLEAFGEPFGESATREEAGRIVYGGGGSGGGGSSTQVTDLPDWAKPYAQETLEKTKQLSNAPYQSYDAPRFAGFSPMQEKAQQTAYNMGTSGQLGTGTGLATAAGLMGLGANYQPGSFANQFQAPQQYQPSQFDMMSAQAPNLQQFQMGPAERAQTQSFTQPGSAESFMSPYMQNVVDKQTREAERQSGIAARQQRAQSIQRGSFGGGRTAVTEAANARDLAQLKSDIYGTGQQAAFQNAQQQFNAEQQARMQAQLANQQAGLTVGGQNLAAQLGVQQLGAGQNLQAQLANQQAYQNMLAQREASRQFGYGQQMTAAQQLAQYGQAAQQLGEQSRQFGAGYGQQGLNTALQAAGQLGNLGQAEFGQQKDIVGLQSQLGAQQQALRQQGLTQAYQDFLNEQNYPYKQLGFMSDMIRGLPLGQQTTRQVYEAPGSALGQIAGLGVGLGGMARFGQMFAEGGEVKEYADGGRVDSPENVAKIVDKLSDEQLNQAEEAARARGDFTQVQAIIAERGMRASERSGMAGAFNSLPQETQEAVTEMASGGIVAFSNGGELTQAEIEAAKKPAFGVFPSATTPRGQRYPEPRQGTLSEFLFPSYAVERPASVDPSRPFVRPLEEEEAAAASRVSKKSEPATRGASQPARRDESRPARASGSISQSNAAAAVRTITEAANVQLPKDETRELAKTLFDELMSKSESERKEFKAELTAAKNRSKEIEARGIGEAMMKFGFGMATAAAKPGRRSGLAGVLESAAVASPLLSESMAETNKLKQAAEDNYMKLRTENARYQTALEQGNMQLAATLANNVSMRKLEQEKLKQQITQQDRLFGLEEKKLDVMRSQASSPTAIQKIANDLMSADPKLDRKSALAEASKLSGYSFRTEVGVGGKLATALAKIEEDYKTLSLLDPNSKVAQQMAADRKRRRDEAYRLYGGQQTDDVTSGQSPAPGAGQLRLVGVR